jgi:UTP--glucose-1-phosphate uridylyltransferase
VRRYGIVAGEADGERLLKVRQIVEKPQPENAPSRMGVAGRYILTPAIFGHIRQQSRGVGGELQLTDGIAGLLKNETVHAFAYAGKRYDCGSKEGFLEATVEIALTHPEVGPRFRDYLRALAV